MIVDKLENINKYPQIPDIDLKFLTNAKLGRHEISDDIYINVEEYYTKPENRFEAHKKYADIQIVLDGHEKLNYGEFVSADYDETKDISFFESDTVASVILDGSNFVMFFPNEAHSPQLSVANVSEKVKKAVVKIRLNR